MTMNSILPDPTGDELLSLLELRVAPLEEIAAARWPRRVLLRRRYARQLRESVRHIDGPSFAARRAQAVTTEWLSR